VSAREVEFPGRVAFLDWSEPRNSGVSRRVVCFPRRVDSATLSYSSQLGSLRLRASWARSCPGSMLGTP